MRQAGARVKSSTPSSESKNSGVIESPGRLDAKRRVFGTGGIFEKNGSRFLYISYRDRNGKLRQESTKSESRMVAERLLRDRLGKVEQGLPVAEMKKLKYEDIRKTLIMDYRARGARGAVFPAAELPGRALPLRDRRAVGPAVPALRDRLPCLVSRLSRPARRDRMA